MRGRGFRTIQLAPVILALIPSLAFASPGASRGAQAGRSWLPPRLAGRHIPRGELTPQVIEKVYGSPRGEVQFTVIESSSSRSAYLRNTKGNLMGFTEVRGGRSCEEWFLSAKGDGVPRGCEFLFYDNVDGRYLSVRSDEMEESDIFGMASGEIQAAAVRGAHTQPRGLAEAGRAE